MEEKFKYNSETKPLTFNGSIDKSKSNVEKDSSNREKEFWTNSNLRGGSFLWDPRLVLTPVRARFFLRGLFRI